MSDFARSKVTSGVRKFKAEILILEELKAKEELVFIEHQQITKQLKNEESFLYKNTKVIVQRVSFSRSFLSWKDSKWEVYRPVKDAYAIKADVRSIDWCKFLKMYLEIKTELSQVLLLAVEFNR